MVKKLIREKNVAHIIIAALFSVSLIFGMSGVNLPLQQPQQEAYASSQVQTQTQAQAQLPPDQVPQSTQAPPSDQVSPPPRRICNPNSPTLQPGSAGAKVAELQRALILVGYGSLLGQGGVDGKFGLSTQNAVKKFQQDYRLPVDGKVGPITWGALCSIIPNSFIVQLKSASPGSFRELMGTLTPLLAKAGGRVVAVYDLFGMFNVVFGRPPTNPEQFIKSLRAHPAVKGVFYDAIVIPSQAPQQTIPSGINRVDADLGPARSGDGRGNVIVDIAILDTGVNRHPDLNIHRCISFHYEGLPQPGCTDGWPNGGHGTRVAGAAAARDNNMGVVGTAPGAKIWALKVIPDTPNSGDDSNILEGLYYVAAHSDEIEVANLSFGHFGYNGAVEAAVNALVIRGVVFVAAAGNENTDISANYNTPGSIPVAITVSAITDSDGKCGGVGRATVQPGSQVKHQGIGITNPDDFFASYSNYGSVVDLFAPGSNILTIDTTGGYSNQSGTSLSAPIVAGAAALTKSLHQAARPEGIDRYLKEIGTQWTGGNPLDPCNGAGQGYFNARYPVPLDRVIHTSWIYNDIRRVSTQPLLYMGNIT